MLSCVNHVVLYTFCCTLQCLLYLNNLWTVKAFVPSKSYCAKPVLMVAVCIVKV